MHIHHRHAHTHTRAHTHARTHAPRTHTQTHLTPTSVTDSFFAYLDVQGVGKGRAGRKPNVLPHGDRSCKSNVPCHRVPARTLIPSRKWKDDITEKEGTTWIRKATDRRQWFVCWLLDVPATRQCISGRDLRRQFLRAAVLRWKLQIKTFHLTQSQYTDIGPTSPSADSITSGAWQGSHWSAHV